ncbi:MAG: hypothetical protein K0S01_1154 [Herbinix sp.]|jgi:hypothetical protein|nr:hypothetical protein [Herbinix sp.]
MEKNIYKFSDCISHCGFHNLPNGLEKYFDLYEEGFQGEIIDKSFLKDCFQRFNVPEAKRKLMENALGEIEEDSILCYFTRFLIWDMCLAMKRFEDNYYNNLVPTCLHNYKEYYPFILLLACVKPSMEMLQNKGVPLKYYEEIPYTPMRKQFDKWILQEDITVSDFPWDINFYTCSIFLMDRFYFIPCKLEEGLSVYRNRVNNRVVALQHANNEFRRDGQFNGTNEVFDDKGKFLSQWNEDDLSIRANAINPMGYVEQTPVILLKADWRLTLTKGDILLAFHIPDGPGYTPQRVRNSMELALDFYATYFRELGIKGFWSESWLYDSRISLVMEYEKSNIVKVQSQFYRYPIKTSDRMLLERVFGDKDVDLSKVICTSNLQQAIIGYMKTGARFNTISMFVLKEDVVKIGDCPYISTDDIESFKTVVDSHMA